MTRLRVPVAIGAFIANVCGVHTSDDVARAQVEALKQRVPYLYAILATNVSAVSITHQHSNPAWQVVLVPIAVVCVLVSRLVWWARLPAGVLTDEQVRRILRSTVRLGGMIGLITLAWAMSLDRGDGLRAASAYMTANGHVDFFVGITVISCIFLMMHLRLAVILLTLIVVVPFSAYLLTSFRLVETAIALNLLLVSAGMLYVAVSFSRDFERMVTNAADLRHLSAQNARLAASDALTGLPNRRRFFKELEQAGQGAAPFAVVVVDLDGFKQVNDVYGHNAGDDVLRRIATSLLGLAPDMSCVARLGGDEFACLLIGEHAGAAPAIAQSMVAACGVPIVCTSFTANIGASAGICLSHTVPDDPLSAYEQADYALFEAKRAGRGRVESFSGKHGESMRRHGRIAHLLRSPDVLDELSAVYQPIFAVASQRINAFEALLRWTSGELGPVGPNEFIPIAERTDLIFEISRHVLRTALDQAATWPDDVSVKVNLSVRDLMSRPQTEALVEAIRQSAVGPSRVTLEVAETIFAESRQVVRSNVDILRAAGCEIAIDDFGAGRSNLHDIHALSPDYIKIERCFVAAVADDEASRRIIRTIIELTRNVGAKSVAEGVETAAQARLLAELGCDELQGYHVSRPVAAEAAREMVMGPSLHGWIWAHGAVDAA